MKKILLWWQPQHALLMARWQSFASYQKNAILYGISLLLVVLLYCSLGASLLQYIATFREEIREEKKTLLWMTEANQQIKALREKPKHDPAQSLALQEKLKKGPLSHQLSQLVLVGDNQIHCVFTQVDFDELMTWLIPFSRKENFTVEEAAIERVNNQGIVRAEFIFSPFSPHSWEKGWG